MSVYGGKQDERSKKIMEIKVDLSAEDIQRQIVDAIAKSAIGAQLQQVILAEVERLKTSYKNPIEGVVRAEIDKLVQGIVTEQFLPQIKEWITEKITEEFTAEMFTKMWEAFRRQY